jgi:hypothetical protein
VLTLRYAASSAASESNAVSSTGTITASIVQNKVAEMKDYTNITGTFTASTDTATDSDWNN